MISGTVNDPEVAERQRRCAARPGGHTVKTTTGGTCADCGLTIYPPEPPDDRERRVA